MYAISASAASGVAEAGIAGREAASGQRSATRAYLYRHRLNEHGGSIFDTPPLDQVAEGYRATDERRAIKTFAEDMT